MLEGIDRSGTPKLPTATKTAAATPATKPAAATTVATASRETVVVSISTTVLEAAVTAPSSPSPSLADQQVERGFQALQQISDSKAKVADTMKGFLRQKLDGLKKQLQILRILGTDALEIAKGSVGIAREVAKTVRDYAGATIDQKNAAAATAADATTTTDKEAQKQAEDLQAQAARAPLTADPSSDNPTDAPKDPDERFFYDAFRLLGLVKRTLVETQRIDARLHGTQHAKDFKKLNHRELDLEKAVTDAYKAMKTGGDLKDVDAALTKDANSSDGGTSILA